MKLQINRTSFFESNSSHSTAVAAVSEEQRHHQAKAAWHIQRWWKQLHLKRTASESFHYVHDLVSLEQAQQDSFPKLEKFLLDPKTISATRELLMHLEQTKDIVLPSRMSLSNVYKAERQFLTAYMIATKSKFLFESPSDIDELLLTRAQEMLTSFEALCAFMSSIYLKEESTISSPLAETTPAADKVFSSIDTKRLKNDQRFITEGRDYLEAFHQKQMAYYETFSEWEAKNRQRLGKILIAKYIEIEEKRFTVLNSLDPRMLELYEAYGKQEETLKKRISFLLHDEGERLLTDELTKLNTALEARKWISSPSEALIHELALDPKLRLSAATCAIAPQKDINAAITVLELTTPVLDPIIEVILEIRNNLAMFTPNNRQQLIRLQEAFNPATMKTKMETLGLRRGLYEILYPVLEQIKSLESPTHVRETTYFVEDMTRRVNEPGDGSSLLKETIDYVYYKLSQINLELKNYQINEARGLIERNIVGLEQKEFQNRLAKKQFHLDYTLAWLDKFVSSPEEYRLNLSILCSKYLGSYASHALMITVLQQPEHSVLYTIPETFYLDRLRLVKWHAQYQNIIYTATALSYLECFCQDQGIKLSPEHLMEEKKRLLNLLELGMLRTPQDKADDLILTVNRMRKNEGKVELSLIDRNTITSLIEKCCDGNNQVNKLINKRVGDQLSYYFFNARLPDSPTPVLRRYGLEAELNKLGKEILPVLRLHNKVHGSYYQQEIEHRLWKPLFATLRQTVLPTALPGLLEPEAASIRKTHDYMHKLAFVLSGLALVQQTIVYSDMWELKTIKNAALKDLANRFGLVEMIKNPRVTKDMIEGTLMEVMQHVATEYKLPYEEAEKTNMAHMLGLAKRGKSLGCKAYLDEISSLTKQAIIENKEQVNPNNLLAEFKEELTEIRKNAQELTVQIKTAHSPEESDPIAPTIPVLRTGRVLSEMGLKM